MEVCAEYYGLPPPPGALGPFLRLSPGDIVELTKAEAEQNWWEVKTAYVCMHMYVWWGSGPGLGPSGSGVMVPLASCKSQADLEMQGGSYGPAFSSNSLPTVILSNLVSGVPP